ncbi:HEAT repeat domain-containing protein [Bacillus sp. FJAT-52991]|uniref:HEAT repeat domain-containing protein n=1 Tax=Bacillus kandeliae TaxID=3129297 RepID=A0ABZ2N578_9BACI
MQLTLLEEHINNNNINEAIEIIETLGKNKNVEAVEFLIQHLTATDNNNLRNAIAIYLADIGCDKAVEPLVDLLKDPKTEGARGTIVYSLGYFNCSNHIEQLADLLFSCNFEISRQSLMLLESPVNKIPIEMKQKYIKKVKNRIEDLCDEIDFFKEALKVLKGKQG